MGGGGKIEKKVSWIQGEEGGGGFLLNGKKKKFANL